MALTNAEKVRAYRERKKAQREAELRKPADEMGIMRTPFFEFYQQGITGDFEIPVYLAGAEPPSFRDDGPAVFSSMLDGLEVPKAPNSLARAEIAVGCLIDAAAELARIVNDYKQSEIKARIAEIEQADLSDPTAKKQALADIVRLQKMLDQLSKQVRWTFPQWKVTGE